MTAIRINIVNVHVPGTSFPEYVCVCTLSIMTAIAPTVIEMWNLFTLSDAKQDVTSSLYAHTLYRTTWIEYIRCNKHINVCFVVYHLASIIMWGHSVYLLNIFNMNRCWFGWCCFAYISTSICSLCVYHGFIHSRETCCNWGDDSLPDWKIILTCSATGMSNGNRNASLTLDNSIQLSEIQFWSMQNLRHSHFGKENLFPIKMFKWK